MFLDPSLGLLWLFAISCIWYGSVRAHKFLKEAKDNEEIKEASTFIQSYKVLILPVFGSIVLIVLFFVLDFSITVYILYALISIVVISSQFFIFAPVADYIAGKISKEPKGIKIPKIGFVPFSGMCLFVYCLAVVAAWITTGHWIFVNAIAVCLGVTQMSLLRLPSMKIATLLLGSFLIYDVFWVFLSAKIFNESVMVSVATRLPPLPLVLKMPRITDPGYYSLLGLGDIVLPGLFIVYVYTMDIYLERTQKIDLSNLRNSYVGYFHLCLVQYTLGFIATLASGYIMDHGQPALLYLVPFTLGITALIAWYRGDIKVFWTGKFEPETAVELHGLLETPKEDSDNNDINNNDNNTNENENNDEKMNNIDNNISIIVDPTSKGV